ncbi:methionine--tRNA ligase, mitochondrial [Diachasma alloeum]|uniref:methionine--tRNA ligase, mitochondrial n=1 Tax=Diachasma alloeum TaxID=454923 RepID=UPI0010FAD748|nr:methionine--tRNA ligase, mitochondrial [Diachasma alloeum]
MANLFRLPIARNLIVQVYKNQSRNIMTTPARAKKLLESLKDNPYFDKYAAAITRLQETNPEEFVSKIEEQQRKDEDKKERAKAFKNDAAAKPALKPSMQRSQARLSDVMKTELLEDKGKDEITDIWLSYHKERDCISGAMDSERFNAMYEVSMKYPTFILPLPRENGYEFILTQFYGTEVHMTPLLWYQTHQENAPECMTIVHYLEFKDSKNLVLMRGQFDTKSINVQEAQCLANQLQLYYSGEENERFALLKTFNERPDEFKHMDLISQMESVSLFTGIKSENKKSLGFFLKPWMRVQTRLYSSFERMSAYVSTPIFYVNAGPHIGHLYSAAMADAVARYNRMLGRETFFSTGTDEHGNKVRNAAMSRNLSPDNYCYEISQLFRGMCDDFHVEYSKFIRTTDEEHQEGVHKFWTNLHNSGHIYLGKYSGWYCMSDEAFVPSSELEELKKPDGSAIKISSASGNPVEWMEEENYKFRLSSFQDDLRHWLRNEKSVQPAKYHRILSNWVEEGACLEDLSVSRPATRAPWGVKVPNDDSHTVYVWLDALINYLTVLGYPEDNYKKFWPPTVQVIGKDILKFHGVYWPAFLIAAGMEPPRTLLCHSHWTVNNEKMSKSKGNVVAPSKAAETFTPDGLRYFLLREAVPHSDANYSEEKIRKILNAELADTLGNLFSRCMGRAVNPRGVIPEASMSHKDVLGTEEAENLVESLHCLPALAQEAYEAYNFHQVVDAVMGTLRCANKMIEHHKPWALVRLDDDASLDKLEAVLALGLESTRVSALILHPIIPRLTENLLYHLQIPTDSRQWRNTEFSRSGRVTEGFAQKRLNSLIFFKRIK